jgi:methionyl-tRNA formyltransferase
MKSVPRIAFFGTPEIAVYVLEELQKCGMLPHLIVTNPDRPRGRGQLLSPTPVKAWGIDNRVPVITPERCDEDAAPELFENDWDLFLVVAYGAILPAPLISVPRHGTLNVHPSLLPKLRGASPIRTAIQNGYKDIGVSIMLMDEKLDHGPIIAQEAYPVSGYPSGTELDESLARRGGAMLCEILPQWVDGRIVPTPQDDAAATYSRKFTKEMAELAIDPFDLPRGDAAKEALLRIRAFDGNPCAFFFHNKKRVKITAADISDDALIITRVIPEGKKETDFAQFLAQAR